MFCTNVQQNMRVYCIVQFKTTPSVMFINSAFLFKHERNEHFMSPLELVFE